MNPSAIAACKAKMAALLDAIPELAEDEAFRVDVFEGETDFHYIVSRLAKEALTAKAEREGLKAYRDEISEKINRKATKEEAIRKTLADLLDVAELPGVKCRSVSVKFATVAPSVVVTDEAALPADFTRVTTSPDKSKIKDALLSGATVPGAEMSNGGRALRITQ